MELSDELVKKALAGHQESFGMIFRSLYGSLCSYAYSFVGDKDEAEELVQNVFTNVWDKRAELQIETSLSSYLYRAVRNSGMNVLKHRKVRLDYASNARTMGHGMAEPASGELIGNELQLRIKEALQRLPEQCRIVFELNRFGELKYAEIAEQLGISVKTVENQMGKALRIMRDELKEYLVS